VRLYKYRDLSYVDPQEFRRLEVMLHQAAFWCARPDTLNDPAEFAWQCDYTITHETIELLARLISQARGRSLDYGRDRAMAAASSGRLSAIASPIIADIIAKCRDEIGLACFGSSARNSILWERYGGNGAGLCVEIEVPDDLLGLQLFEVQYPSDKVIPIAQLMRAALDSRHVRDVYELSLLCKPKHWAPEAEIRFISKMQNVLVTIDRSRITNLHVGSILAPSTRQVVERIVASLPYRLPINVA